MYCKIIIFSKLSLWNVTKISTFLHLFSMTMLIKVGTNIRVMCDPWFKFRIQITLFQMAVHQYVREISCIMQRSILTHHAGTDGVILVYLLVKIINLTHSRIGYVRPLNIFTDHAHLTDHISWRLVHVCRCLL
jgi:hypothetical protein